MTSTLWSSTDTQRQRFTRRQLVTAGVLSEERRAPRVMMIAAVAITACGDAQQRTGLLRDWSVSGIFVYSNFEPRRGEALDMVVRLSDDVSNSIALACKGVVVRVEKAGSGAAFGIALQIASYELLLNGKPVAGANGFAAISEQLRAGSPTAA